MKINLKCFLTLVNLDACDYNASTPVGSRDQGWSKRVGIAREDVKIAFVNSRITDLDEVLSDGDRVGLAPAVGGM
jgi:hypothetical protein